MENLNLLFYKTFYTKLGQGKAFETDVGEKAKKLVFSKFYKEDYKPVCSQIAPEKFMLKTSYPGLLVGTGYAHGVDADDDIKVGFSFDYVTGQPYIPGSSVKGLLRSYFAHPEVIRCFLDDAEIDVKALEKSIFGTNDEASDDGVDTFFDVVVRRGDKNGKVMGFDAITPHGEDLTKNPTPIKILKVMPDVVFEFAFNLKDSAIGGRTITAEQKKDLFLKLLINFGIGAKTNVGYGVLTELLEKDLEGYTWPDRNASANRSESASRSDVRDASSERIDFVKDKAYEAIVNGGNEKNIFIKVEGKSCKCFLARKYLRVELKAGDKVKVSYLYTTQYGNHCFKYEGRV